MTIQIQEMELGNEGRHYVRESLRSGKELSKHLQEVVDLELGRLSTFLPSELTSQQVNQFSYGGKFPPPSVDRHKRVRFWGRDLKAIPIQNADEELISVVESYLKAGNRALCIFENALASPGDPVLTRIDVQTVTVGSSVYHFLTPERMERDLIERTVKRSKSICPPLIGVLARLSKPTGFHSGDSLSLTELREIAGRTEKLIVGVYDGEGFLLWSKST